MGKYDILKEAIRIVLEHKEEMDKCVFESIHYKALGIKRGDQSRENLKKWFILTTGPGWRGGPPPPYEERKVMVKEFDDWYDEVVIKILPNYDGQEAMDRIYRKFMQIKWIGPKIAGVYLEDIIYKFGVWSHLVDYLYLPIDRHVHEIMFKKLKVFSEDEVPAIGESFFTRRNQRFQAILDSIHKPRIEFDYFWVVGSTFCAYHLCDFCWIKELCKDRRPIPI